MKQRDQVACLVGVDRGDAHLRHGFTTPEPRQILRLANLTSDLISRSGDCESVLAEFSKAGINLAALAEQWQDEVAKFLVNSWNGLMGVIAMKSAVIR